MMRHGDTGCEYEIRLRGRFDDRSLGRFTEFNDRLAVCETVLRGWMTDTAELHGVLDRLQDLGFELLEARPAQHRRSSAQRR